MKDKPTIIVADTLAALCEQIAGPLPDGHRVYTVGNSYVLANSPAQAAMAVVKPVRVSDRDLSAGLLAVIADKAKAKG